MPKRENRELADCFLKLQQRCVQHVSAPRGLCLVCSGGENVPAASPRQAPAERKSQPSLATSSPCSCPKPRGFSCTAPFHTSALCRINRVTCKFPFCRKAFSSVEINPLRLLKLDPVLHPQSQTRSKPLT